MSWWLIPASALGLWLWSNLQDDDDGFEFQKKCRDAKGSIMWYKSDDADDYDSGRLLSCRQVIDFENQESLPLFSEYEDIESKVKRGEYAPSTEKQRLKLYFSLVYPETPMMVWENMSKHNLVQRYQDLEVYYRMPKAIEPQTPRRIVRSKEPRFYRLPRGVILDQRNNRKASTKAYIEVVRFGTFNRPFRDPVDFQGTYYYPVRGSGVFLPLGNTLVVNNKVSALTQLGVTPKEMLPYAGKAFIKFLQTDSKAAWREIKENNPDAKKSKYWKTTAGRKYIPSALTRMVEEMNEGKCLREACVRVIEDGKTVDKSNLVYYGIGPSADEFLAQMASSRGYDSIQLLKEAQAGITRDAVVGSEIIHLMEPLASQNTLRRLDPTMTPLPPISDNPPFNYLLKTTGQVDVVSTNANVKKLIATREGDSCDTILRVNMLDRVPEWISRK